MARLTAARDAERRAALRLLEAARSGRLASWRMPETAALPGLPIPIWRGEAIDAVICVLVDDDHPLRLLDNDIGACAACRRRVQFRPTSPPGPRLCIECAAARLARPPRRNP